MANQEYSKDLYKSTIEATVCSFYYMNAKYVYILNMAIQK